MDTLTTISRLVVFIDTSLRFVIGLSIVLFFTIILACSYRQKVSKKTDKIIHLLSIFVPTAVAWEHDYSKLFTFSESERRTTIRLPLSSLLQNLSNGSLELRDLNDLAPLLSSRLHVSGWTLALKIELTWWLRTFYRLALDKSFPGMYRSPMPGQPSEFTSEHLEINQDTSTRALLYDLDSVPYGYLETAIRDIQQSQAKDVFVIFEFSTVSERLSYSSPSFIFCGVSILEDEGGRRTSTPLLLSLHRAVELFSGSAFNIQSIHDVSASHANLLREKTHHLVADKVIRTSFTGSKGLERWRKARLLLAWEAALLTNGHMTRWRVLCSPDSIKQACNVNF